MSTNCRSVFLGQLRQNEWHGVGDVAQPLVRHLSLRHLTAPPHGLAAALDGRVDERETLAVRAKIQRCDVVAVQPLMGSAMAR